MEEALNLSSDRLLDDDDDDDDDENDDGEIIIIITQSLLRQVRSLIPSEFCRGVTYECVIQCLSNFLKEI